MEGVICADIQGKVSQANGLACWRNSVEASVSAAAQKMRLGRSQRGDLPELVGSSKDTGFIPLKPLDGRGQSSGMIWG